MSDFKWGEPGVGKQIYGAEAQALHDKHFASQERINRLVINIKTRNGRRKSMDFIISEIEATDPASRAAAITKYGNQAEIALNGRLVNWNIEN